MPILTCPTCGSKLEVADEDIGHMVQCGSCQQTFTAEDPTQKKNDGASRKPYKFKERDDEDDDRPSRRRDRDRDNDDDDRPSRRRRRDGDDDDDDRDARYRGRRRDSERDYERRYGQAPQTGMGITSLVMGIASIPLVFVCYLGIPCAIMGIIFGILSLKTAGRGMGIAGIITSCVSFLLLIAVIVFYIIIVAASGGPGGGGPGGGPGGGGGGRF